MAASTNISYKGATIATIAGSGTKTLNTQGKYCEGNITVQCTDDEVQTQTKSVTPTESAQTVTPDSGKLLSSVSVGAIPSSYVGSGVTRKATQTFTPTTTDQTIAAGQYLSGTQTVKGDVNLVAANIKSGVTIFGVTGTHSGGTTPSGSVTITENGTYDVTDKASAVVELPYVYKRWVFTNTQEVATSYNTTLVSDSWLADHCNDPNLEIEVTALHSPSATDTEKIFFVHAIGKNTSLTSGVSYPIITTRIGKSTAYSVVLTNNLVGKNVPTSNGQIRLLPSGALQIHNTSSNVLAVGRYEIIARLIP